MDRPAFQYPDLQTLIRRLDHAFGANLPVSSFSGVIDRKPNPHASTYASELITCQLADGGKIQLICKYSAGRDHRAYGHRGGVAYEGQVYRQVLQRLALTAPGFFGVQNDPAKNESWLFIEFIPDSFQIRFSNDRAKDRELMLAAAEWLGRFHRLSQPIQPPSFLHRYDSAYYLSWANRTQKLAAALGPRYPWFPQLCRRFKEAVEVLVRGPEVVIHGEFYPENILYHRQAIYPVDWESAALAAGEIDLASLTDRWPQEIADRCKDRYIDARWDGRQPDEFVRRQDLATLYWQFRWLGERQDWTSDENSSWRFEELHTVGGRLEMI